MISFKNLALLIKKAQHNSLPNRLLVVIQQSLFMNPTEKTLKFGLYAVLTMTALIILCLVNMLRIFPYF